MLKRGVEALLPFNSTPFLAIVLGLGIVVFAIAHMMRVPQSFSVNFTAMLLGISIARSLRIEWGFVLLIFAFWIIAPIASIAAMRILMNLARSFVRKKRIWSVVKYVRLMLILLSFFAAFTLGANTIGLLYSVLPENYYSMATAIIGIVFGTLFLSGGELRRISNEIIPIRYVNAINAQLVSVVLVEIATLIGIPLSNTQTFVAGIYGGGLSYKNRMLLKRPIASIATTWVGGAVVSFALAYVSAIILA